MSGMHEGLYQDSSMPSIPRDTAEYLRHPFDPNLTFTVNGRTGRYMASPLDEVYLSDPGDCVCAGSLPPEECEVRDYLTVAAIRRRKVTRLEFWWSQLFKPTKAYQLSLEAFLKLEALASRSAEHRAAFLRISGCSNVPSQTIKDELKRMVRRADRRKGIVEA